MNWTRLINFRDLNIWLAISAVGCGIVLMFAVAAAISGAAASGVDMTIVGQIAPLLGTFLATFVTALITGWIAKENGLTYGILGSAGVVVALVFAIPLSVLTALAVVTAIAGGLNGGLLIERWNRRPRR
jgi:hypothetical protein